MKLPIKNIYFNQIKDGRKKIEYRDAHITFINEETGEHLRMEITDCKRIPTSRTLRKLYPNIFEDEYIISFALREKQ